MNTTTTNQTASKTENKAFRNSDNPSLVIRTLKGLRWVWPIASLSEITYHPSVFIPGENNTLNQFDELKIVIGFRQVRVLGLNLDKVCDVLELGTGGTLVEQGQRYRALTKNGEPHVDSVEVTDVGAKTDDDTEETPTVEDDE
jgi:hypothetical protein